MMMNVIPVPEAEIRFDAIKEHTYSRGHGGIGLTSIEVIDLLTTPDLIQRFRRTKATIEKWRGLAADPLPYVRIRGTRQDTIRFRVGAVKAWARRTGRVFHPAT